MTLPTALPGRITVVGLGYVGLPLAVAFSKHLPVTGLDVNSDRIADLNRGVDHNREIDSQDLIDSQIDFTSDPGCLADAEFIIVTVPTPVDERHEPDLRPLLSASEAIGRQLANRSPGSTLPVIVFESTTFPGCTEEICGPAIAQASGLKQGEGFKLGYSPERTNFGDRDHNLATIIKVVSGQDEETAERVEAVYKLVAEAGTYRAPDIQTAEAAKVIENIQRDLNIALVNELAVIFDRLGLSTSDVLAAASTKWNFMPFRPGLVGGHCIPVDPYYLTHKSLQSGYEPQVITAGRRVNEAMAQFVTRKLLDLVSESDEPSSVTRVLVLGLAFKPGISDARNSKIVALTRALESSGAVVDIHDPRVGDDGFRDYGLKPTRDPFSSDSQYDAVVLATPHHEFVDRRIEEFQRLLRGPRVFIDVTGAMDRAPVQELGIKYWRP